MQYVLFSVGLALVIACLVGLYYKNKDLVNWKIEETINYKKKFTILGALSLGLGISTLLMCIGITVMANWTNATTPVEWVDIVFGSLLIGISTGVLITTFKFHFYKETKPAKLDKIAYISMLVSPFIIVAGLWILTEGYCWHMEYPLPNGLNFTQGFVSPGHGSPTIAWYALCILTGALICYAICDHFMYKEFGKHGLLESTFLIAFPAGIIGARIGYVIGNWNGDGTAGFIPFADRVANGEWWSIFAIWEGGLTILSGAIIGIIVGVLWFKWRHPNLDLGKGLNIIVPTILIAQGVGRWGNFFNCEVHGLAVARETFAFLPNIILNNLQYTASGAALPDGQIYVPLFLIESVVNFAGYFILFFGCTKGLKKYVAGGDVALGYVGWYGMTRVLMEPLRDPTFNMGKDGAWSWIWSIIYVAFAIFAIALNHLIRYLVKKHKGTVAKIDNPTATLKYSNIQIAVIIIVATALFGTGLALFLNNPAPVQGESQIALIPHNIGLILWIIGLSIYGTLIIPAFNIYEAVYQKKHPIEEVVNE